MTTAPHLIELDEATRQQRTAQDNRDDAAAAHLALRAELVNAVADGTTPTADDLARLRAARDHVEVTELAVAGTALRRQRLEDEQRGTTTPPTPGDPRGIVRVRVAGKAGRHACNVPSSSRPLLGGEEVDVPAEDALALATAGYVELAGDLPAWWPRHIPAYGQLAAALA